MVFFASAAGTSRDSRPISIGKPWKRSTKFAIMLAREQGGRATSATCMPGHRRDEGGAQRDLGLAEADVAADQPVHRLARREVAEHVLDRAVLVVGLLVGEAVDELRDRLVSGSAIDAGAGGAQRGGLDQLAGDLADPLLHPRLAPLPGFAAEPVERDAFARRCRSGQSTSIFSTGT